MVLCVLCFCERNQGHGTLPMATGRIQTDLRPNLRRAVREQITTKENAQIPDKWIEGACAGLFQNGVTMERDVTSLAALGAVMGLGRKSRRVPKA